MHPDTCPNCGADLPASARSCPDCGSCPETGWSEEARVSDLGLPDDSFDYDDFAAREFGVGKRRSPRKPAWVWIATAAVLLVLWGFWAFR